MEELVGEGKKSLYLLSAESFICLEFSIKTALYFELFLRGRDCF